MADNTIDTLVIKVEGQGESAIKTLDKVASALEKIKSVSSGNGSNAGKRLSSLKESINGINSEGLSKLNNLFETLNNMRRVSIPGKISDRITEIGKAVRSLDGVDFTQLNRMADGLAALQRVQNVRVPNINTGRSQTPDIPQTPQNPAPDFSGTVDTPDTEKTLNETKKFSDVLSGVKDKLKSISSNAVGVGKNIKSAFSATIIGRFLSKLGETLRALKRIAIYRFMRTIIKSITEGFKTGIEDMYQYSKAFNGEYARNMDTLASANLTFKNSLGAIIAPLVNLVTPWLDKFITKLYEINNTIAMVIAGLTGKSTYSKAVRVATEYAAAADKATKSTSKVKEKVDELKRSLAGLDEITIIGDLGNSPIADSGIADIAKNTNTPDYSTMFVETPVDMEKISKVRDMLEKILNLAKLVGLALLAWNIAKFLGELGLLKGLLSKLKFAAGLTLSIVGLKLIWDGIKSVFDEGLNWDNFWKIALGGTFLTGGATLLGHSLGKGFGAKIGFSIGLVLTGIALDIAALADITNNGLNWNNLMTLLLGDGAILAGATYLGKQAGNPKIGFKLGLAITGITLEFAAVTDSKKAGEEIKKKYGNLALLTTEGLWEVVGNTLKTEGIGAAAGAAIGTAIAPGWGTLIGGLIGAVGGMITSLVTHWDQFVTVFKVSWVIITSQMKLSFQMVADFFSGVAGFFSELGSNIENVWVGVTSWFDANVIKPIVGFFTELWNGVSKLATDVATIVEAVWITVTSWFDSYVIQPILTFFTGLWNGIKNVWSAVSTWFDTYVIKPVVAFFSSAIENIKNFFIGLWNNIKNIWINVSTWFNTNVIKPVVGFFSGAINNIKNFFVNLWSNIKGIWSTVSNWFNTTVIQPVVKFFSTAVDKIKGFFSGLWQGIKDAGVSAINWLAQRAADIVNGLIDGINWFIDKFNSIGKWASGVTGKEFFYVKEIQYIKAPKFAEGGFPEDGLFYANHNELVGQFSNGKTAVANNGQIIEGISQGVESANEEQNNLLKEQNRLLRLLLEKRSTIDVTTITNAMSRKNQRDGRVTVPVST